MDLVNLQDTKLMQRNLLHSHSLTTKDQKQKLRKQSHSLLQQQQQQQQKDVGINLPNGEKTVSSISGAGRTGQLHVKE